jgi:hypothetical protein
LSSPRSASVGALVTDRRSMRAIFTFYLVGITGGISYFVVIGLSHH